VKFVAGVRTNVCAISINDYLYHMNELKKSYGKNLIAIFKINQEIENIERFEQIMYENSYTFLRVIRNKNVVKNRSRLLRFLF
jgi:hypothetical protein